MRTAKAIEAIIPLILFPHSIRIDHKEKFSLREKGGIDFEKIYR